jgi:integrase
MPAKGDGITKRKDGRYMARYTIYTPDGPKRKMIYGRKYKEVERKLAEARGDAARGITYDAGSTTVGDYLIGWLADSVRDTVRQRTYERQESIVRVHLIPSIGREKLKTLTPAHVRSLYRLKLDTGLAPRTVLHIHRTLSKALKQAVMDGLIPRNAAASVKPPQPRREEIRPLNREQVCVLFEAVRGDRLEAMYIVAVTTGLRRGELQGLKWEDLDLEAGTLQVRRTLWQEHGLVFPSSVGTPISGGNLNRAFKATLQRAGLPKSTRFHDLRHTCATLLLKQGVNPKFVQELLGHADISLTLNVYSHVLPDMGDAAAGAMDDRSRWCQSGVRKSRHSAGAFSHSCNLQDFWERAWKDSNLRLAV